MAHPVRLRILALTSGEAMPASEIADESNRRDRDSSFEIRNRSLVEARSGLRSRRSCPPRTRQRGSYCGNVGPPKSTVTQSCKPFSSTAPPPRTAQRRASIPGAPFASDKERESGGERKNLKTK